MQESLHESADHLAPQWMLRWIEGADQGCICCTALGEVLAFNSMATWLLGHLPSHLQQGSRLLQAALGWPTLIDQELKQINPTHFTHARLVGSDGVERSLKLKRTILTDPQQPGTELWLIWINEQQQQEAHELIKNELSVLAETGHVVKVFSAHDPLHSPHGDTRLLDLADRAMPEDQEVVDDLRHAWQEGRSGEWRYVVHHPSAGPRWMLSRIDQRVLQSGRQTHQILTLDITEQHLIKLRSDQLLSELSTLLQTTTTGIAYFHRGMLVRCNERFERFLGLHHDAVGQTLSELVIRHPSISFLQGLEEGMATKSEMELELQLPLNQDTDANLSNSWLHIISQRLKDDRKGASGFIVVITDITRLKLQQQRLEAFAYERELMFNVTDLGVARIENGRILQGNMALARMIGIDVKSLAGFDIDNALNSPGFLEQLVVKQSLSDKQRDEEDADCDERLLRRVDGREIWVQIRAKYANGMNNNEGIIVSVFNTHARHQAEQALVNQSERIRQILNSVLVGIVIVGQGGEMEWLNHSALRMFGGEQVDFIGKSISTMATRDEAHPFRQTSLYQSLRPDQTHNFECQVQAMDGRRFWVAGNLVATHSLPDEKVQLTFALLDIDRRRRAEETLQRVIDMAPMLITLRNAKTWHLEQINRAGVQMLGRSHDELIGTSLDDIYASDVANLLKTKLQMLTSGQFVEPHELSVQIDHRRHVWEVRYALIEFPHAESAPSQIMMVSTDVTTQRAAAQEQLNAQVAQKEMLVREVHHRIKNNLQGVAGLLQQIAIRKPEVSTAIAEVVGQVHAIAQVYGLQVHESGHLRITDVVRAIGQSVERLFGRTILLQSLDEDQYRWALPEAESIPIALTLNELLTNAVKHGEETVSVQIKSMEDAVSVEMRNIGQLPDGFDVNRVKSGVSGLSLIKALLPRRGASLELWQDERHVISRLTLMSPRVIQSVDTFSDH